VIVADDFVSDAEFPQVVSFFRVYLYRSVTAAAPAGAAKTVHSYPEMDPASLLIVRVNDVRA